MTMAILQFVSSADQFDSSQLPSMNPYASPQNYNSWIVVDNCSTHKDQTGEIQYLVDSFGLSNFGSLQMVALY